MRVITIPQVEFRRIYEEHHGKTGSTGEAYYDFDEPEFTWYDFTDEIAAGTEVLDKYDPRWFNKIHLSWLELSSGRSCVLGQLAMTSFKEQVGFEHGDYGDVMRVLRDEGDSPDNWGIGLGFCVPQHLNDAEDEEGSSRVWEHLTWQWADQVEKLRANAA